MFSFKDSVIDGSTEPFLVTSRFFPMNSSKAFCYRQTKEIVMDNEIEMAFYTVSYKN